MSSLNFLFDLYSTWAMAATVFTIVFMLPRMGFCRIFAGEGNFKQPPQMEAPDDPSDKATECFRTAKEAYAKDLRQKLDEISIAPGNSIMFGAVICGLIFVQGLAFMNDGLTWTGVTLALFGPLFFFLNLVNIPQAWKGVPFVFNKRNRRWSAIFDEGLHWFPRPFINAGLVDMRELTLDYEQLHVVATGRVEEQVRKAGVEIDAAIQYRIWDPWIFYTAGVNIVTDGLRQLGGNIFREEASYRSIDEMISDKRSVKQHVEDAGDRRSDRWGIMILDVPITRIAPTSKTVMSAYEKLTVEAQERPAEVLERDHVIKSVKEYQDALGIEDGEAALMAFDDTRGKAHNRQRITFGGSGGGSLEHAAAIFGTVLGNAFSNNASTRNEEESS